jgi:ribosomal protein S18 acetylase RimI-like enzyme
MTDWDRARELLERDRVWCAYALADLDPALREFSDVWIKHGSVLLRYRGLEPAVLFAYGRPEVIRTLYMNLEPARYSFTFDLSVRAELDDLLTLEHEVEMHRMDFRGPKRPVSSPEPASRLSSEQLDDILALIDDQPDRPDAFDPGQVASGTFFGVWQAGNLVAMAGTHVVSRLMDVAAIGNVFTHPDWRGAGFARAASAAVLEDLLAMGIRTIVLNTQVHNQAATKLYSGLGFESYCPYMEGVALIPS